MDADKLAEMITSPAYAVALMIKKQRMLINNVQSLPELHQSQDFAGLRIMLEDIVAIVGNYVDFEENPAHESALLINQAIRNASGATVDDSTYAYIKSIIVQEKARLAAWP